MKDDTLSIHEIDLMMEVVTNRLEALDGKHDQRDELEIDGLEASYLKLYQLKDTQPPVAEGTVCATSHDDDEPFAARHQHRHHLDHGLPPLRRTV